MPVADALRDANTRRHSLFGQAKAAAIERAGAPDFIAGGGSYSAMSSLGGATVSNHEEQYRHFTGWVYAAIQPIARRIAGQPVYMARKRPSRPQASPRRGFDLTTPEPATEPPVKRPHPFGLPKAYKMVADELEIVADHELLTLIERPNSCMGRTSLMFMTVASLQLTGKAIWWIGDVDGKKQIWPLPASWVTPLHKPGHPFAAFRIMAKGSATWVDVPGDEIAYMYYPDPSDPLNAVSPLQAQAKVVATDESVLAAQHASFKNSIFPTVVLSVGRHPEVPGVPGSGSGKQRMKLTPSQRDQIITTVKQLYQGVLKYGEPLILDALIDDVKPFSHSAREMDFRTSGLYTKNRVLQGFGVSPVNIGEIEGANRASAAVADDILVLNVLNPIMEVISEALTLFVARREGDNDDLILYLEPLRAHDPEMNLKEVDQLMRYGAIGRGELRVLRGWPRAMPKDDTIMLFGGQLVVPTSGEIPVAEVARGGRSILSMTTEELVRVVDAVVMKRLGHVPAAMPIDTTLSNHDDTEGRNAA